MGLRIALISCFLLAPVAWPQLDRASVNGTVTDTSGAKGAYTFSLLPIGVYKVTVTQAGFRTVTVNELRLGVGDNRTLDLVLEVGNLESSVTVEGVLAPVDSTSAVVGTVIGARQMREIPLNGRHWASLMALAPGAINTGDGSQQTSCQLLQAALRFNF